MTNYNERLDDILYDYWARHRNCDNGCNSPDNGEITKQAITSLTKELVADAKPGTWVDPEDTDDLEWQGYVLGVIDYEQNLLKALETQE